MSTGITGGLHHLTKRLQKHFSRRKKQTTFVVIGTLRVGGPLSAFRLKAFGNTYIRK